MGLSREGPEQGQSLAERGKHTPSSQLTEALLVLPVKGFAKRKRTAQCFVGSLLAVSTLIVTIGLAATTRTENVTVGGYYPGIIVSARPWERRAGRGLLKQSWAWGFLLTVTPGGEVVPGGPGRGALGSQEGPALSPHTGSPRQGVLGAGSAPILCPAPSKLAPAPG